jgi:tetratricopeptide (TPR) repeat protein
MTVPVSKTAESLMYDAVVSYESGDVYQALNAWKQVLSMKNDHAEAQRYIEFVQGHFKLSTISERVQVESAVNQYAQSLRHQQTGASVASTAESIAAHPAPRIASQRQPMAEVSEDNTTTPAKSNIDAYTAPSVEHMAEASVIAKQAMIGPSGLKTQADGLSIKSLSRLLADLHRAGKYEQAVQTAESLLEIDPQHAVAKRYIEEYNRQKEAALSRQKRKQTQGNTAQQSATSSSTDLSALQRIPRTATSASNQMNTSSSRGQHEKHSDAPTVIPHSVAPDLSLDNLAQKPKILMRSDQISWQNFDHRAGFFLSQVDGRTSYEDLIEISGMKRSDALKILSKLVESSVIGH